MPCIHCCSIIWSGFIAFKIYNQGFLTKLDVGLFISDYCLGLEMATHSSILAWKIPWTEESGRLQSMGSQSWT